MNASMGPASPPRRHPPRRPPCRPRVEILEGRLTPSFGSVLDAFYALAPVASENFGASVAVGDSVVIGAPGAAVNGKDAVGDFADYTFSLQGPLLVSHPPPSGPANGNLGASAAAAGDWEVVGSPGYNINPGLGSGGAFAVYKGGTPRYVKVSATPGEHLGSSVAVWDHYAVVGAPDYPMGAVTSVGRAYLYDLDTGNLLATLPSPHPVANGRFGASVAMALGTVLVGSPGDTDTNGDAIGRVAVFDVLDLSNITSHFLVSPDQAANEQFGFSVSLTQSGSDCLALIGAPGNGKGGVNAGSAYLADLGTNSWLLKLHDPAQHAWDAFGWSVAISGTKVLVGAPGDGTAATAAGRAYLYHATDTGGTPLTLGNPYPHAFDGFGWSVALPALGMYAVVGAPFDDTGATDAGAAYVLDLTPNSFPPVPHPGPQPVPPASDRHAIAARTYRVKRHHRRLWEVAVADAVTGRLLAEFRCPFQGPAYRRIQMGTADANHDGLADTVVLTARRGRRTVSRTYPMA